MRSYRNRFLICLLAFILTAILASFGHEGGKHLLGSVQTVEDGSFTIVTQNNERITVSVLPTTKFVMSGHPATLKDLKPGERIVVHAKQNGKSWEAQEVHFGRMKASAKQTMNH